MGTRIEWATETWNPVVGCTKVSPACDHCYALTMARRIKAMSMAARERGEDPGRRAYYEKVVERDEWESVQVVSEALDDPLHWAKPRTVFVVSMGDLFHRDVPDNLVRRVWSVMRDTPRHTYIVLTKRPGRMRKIVKAMVEEMGVLSNVIGMTTVEDQIRASQRIHCLLTTPFAYRGVSIEPMLEPVDLRNIGDPESDYGLDALTGDEIWRNDIGWVTHDRYGVLPRLDWVIVGGETGPGARPMRPDWVRAVRDQCDEELVPFFFKSWGDWFPRSQWEDNPDLELPDDDELTGQGVYMWLDGDVSHRVGKKLAGRVLDGETWNQVPGVVHA